MSILRCARCAQSIDTDYGFTLLCHECVYETSLTVAQLFEVIAQAENSRCECTDASYEEPACTCDRCSALIGAEEELERRAETELVGVA